MILKFMHYKIRILLKIRHGFKVREWGTEYQGKTHFFHYLFISYLRAVISYRRSQYVRGYQEQLWLKIKFTISHVFQTQYLSSQVKYRYLGISKLFIQTCFANVKVSSAVHNAVSDFSEEKGQKEPICSPLIFIIVFPICN